MSMIPFVGIHALPALPDNETYEKLTDALKKYYTIYMANTEKRLYETMQEVDERHATRLTEGDLLQFKNLEKISKDKWWRVEAKEGDDRYWYYVSAKKEAGFDIGPWYIKVTISVKDNRGSDVFLTIARGLIEKAKNEFRGKLTKYSRLETMVFWVKRDEFDLIEKILEQYDELLITPLLFVGYRGKMAISRDLYFWGSHNAQQAELMQAYFKYVEKREDVSLEGMYQYLLDSWNNVLPDEENKKFPLNRTPFAYADAQLLIILLESLLIVLGEREITDNHIFLSEDKGIWELLGRSCSWKEYGENLRCYKEKGYCVLR